MTAVLKWWFIVACSAAALVLTGAMGMLTDLWKTDATKISFAVLALYTLVSLFIGHLTIKARRLANHPRIREHVGACYFAADVMVDLGLLGTVIGFLMMLGTAFASIDLGNLAAAQAAMSKMAAGVSVALVTTLVGLTCSMLTRAQLANLDLETGHA